METWAAPATGDSLALPGILPRCSLFSEHEVSPLRDQIAVETITRYRHWACKASTHHPRERYFELLEGALRFLVGVFNFPWS